MFQSLFQGASNVFERVLKVFQAGLLGVSEKLHGFILFVWMAFQGSFKFFSGKFDM